MYKSNVWEKGRKLSLKSMSKTILVLAWFGVLEQKLFRDSILVVVEVGPRQRRVAAVGVVVLTLVL